MPENLGRKIRAIRESRSLTLETLAERSGVREELVGKIEAGDLIPSLSPLIRIARALGVRLGTFLDDQENIGPVVTRSGEQQQAVRFSAKDHPMHSDLDFYSLAANKSGRHMEPFLIDIHPSSAQEARASAHEGEEFIHVFYGEVEIAYGHEAFQLAAGDSIYYDSIVPHHVHCAGRDPARILAVVYAPL